MFHPNIVFYCHLYIPLPPFSETKDGDRNFDVGQTTQSKVAVPHLPGCYSLCKLSPWFQENDYVVERVSQICVSKKMRTSVEMQNCSSGLRTLVAFRNLSEITLPVNIPKSKHSPGESLTDGQLGALCPVYLTFASSNSHLGMASLGHHTAHALSKTSGNFSKTFDDWNTAAQCLDLFTSIWMSYFESELLFLIFCCMEHTNL